MDPSGLRISGARFRDELNLAHIQFAHPLHLVGCALDELFDLSGAALKELSLQHSRTHRVKLYGAAISGDVLAPDLDADGAVDAIQVHIDGRLDLRNAKLRNADGPALNLDGAKITGCVFAGGMEADGEVRAIGVQIGEQLDLRASKLRNAQGYALILNAAEIANSVFAQGLEADGEINAVRIRNPGQFDIRNCKLRRPDGIALGLDGGTTGDLYAGGLEVEGEFRAVGVHFVGQVDLTDAKLGHAGAGALTLDGADITEALFARGLEADGQVSAMEIRIAGRFDLTNAKLRHTAADVLVLDGSRVGELVAGGLEADGQVRAVGAHIGGTVDFRSAKLRNDGDTSLNLESASIKKLMLDSLNVRGGVSLYRATITDLSTDANPPGPLVATGWEVTDIHGPLRERWHAARQWLESSPETSVQPWHALAAVYERNGDPTGAKRLRLAAASRVTRQSPLLPKLLRCVYGAVVGYGYYPLLAAAWLIVVVLTGSIVVAANRNDFVPNRDATNAAATVYLEQTHMKVPDAPQIKPLHYTLSAVLPTAVGNATSDWNIKSTWVSFVLTSLKLIAWVLTALLVAGVSGLLRKA
ncbi:hypothetical protein AWB92_24790 [Mycobacterium sp. IEC1808]|nr:hypothetical protein AWB92_24790 [Mycobacterium sp. IEC1808]